MDRVPPPRLDPVDALEQEAAATAANPVAIDPASLARLRESETRYRHMFEAAQDGILLVDATSAAIQDANPFLLRLLGCSRAALIGCKLRDAAPFAELPQSGLLLATLQRKAIVRYDCVPMRTAAGLVIQVEWIGHAYDCGGQRVIQCSLRDVTERCHQEHALTQMAFHDPLTHLPNRRLLLDRLEQARRACRRELEHAGLLYIDLDDFKGLNDSRGHQAGDEMLVEAARRLRAVVRDCDTVARYGGDEFVILLEHLGASAQAAQTAMDAVAGKVAATLAEPYVLGGRGYRGGCSLGSHLFQGNETSARMIVEEADAAMYVCKQAKHQRADAGRAAPIRA